MHESYLGIQIYIFCQSIYFLLAEHTSQEHVAHLALEVEVGTDEVDGLQKQVVNILRGIDLFHLYISSPFTTCID